MMELEYVLPKDIERRSFELIEAELGDRTLPDEIRPIVMRAIHTTADFDYYDNMYFSDGAVQKALSAIESGAVFVTDTNMARSGINKAALGRHGCTVECFMADPDVAEKAAAEGTTRAAAMWRRQYAMPCSIWLTAENDRKGCAWHGFFLLPDDVPDSAIFRRHIPTAAALFPWYNVSYIFAR